MPSITDLQLKKGQLAKDAGEIITAAHQDGREALRKEEEDKFNSIHTDIEALTSQIKILQRQDEVERSLGEPGQRKSEPNPISSRTGGDSRLSSGVRDQHDAVRGWFLAGAPSMEGGVPDRYRQAASRVGLKLDSKSLTFRLGGNAMQSKHRDDIIRWEQLNTEERAQSGPQNSTSVGGFTIQDAAMREVEIALLSFGAMRRAGCTIIRTDTGGPLPIPTVNDTTNLGHLVTEGTTIVTTDVVFAQLVLDAWKYTSDKVLVSTELMQDNSINLPSVIGRILGERIGRVVNRDFTTGTGTGQPNGIVNAATFTQLTTGSSSSLTLTNLVTLYHQVDPAYRDNAKWMFNDNTLSKIKLLVDSQSRPLWLPGLVDRAPDTLLGSPYVINQDMASVTSTGKSILFGDFSKYWIRDVRDITLLRLDERFAEFLQVAFLAFMRTDGDLLDAGTKPVRGLQQATA
jgi:HK97 family phage major capsid protein